MKHLFTRSFIIVLSLLSFSMASAKQLYVIGDGVFGGWNPGNPVPMTLDADGVTNTMTVSTTGTVYWTICDGADSNWDVFNTTYRYGVQKGNYNVAIGEYELTLCEGTFVLGAGEYTITVNSETMKMTITGVKEDLVISSISIVGELTGGWDAEANVLDLTEEGDGIWTGSLSDFEAEGGKAYQWKVIANHRWGDFELPSEGNYEVTFDSDGIYDLVFTVDVNEQTANIGFEKKGDVVIEKTYVVAGDESLMGVDWDPESEDNEMTESEEGVYKFTKTVDLVAGTTYSFKVVANANWSTSYGGDGENGNFEFTVDEDGTYEITFVFDSTTQEVGIELVNTGIGTVQSSKLNVQSVIYNLRGQRVNASTRGILIVNGKKVVVK